jgi:hypothetical protein
MEGQAILLWDTLTKTELLDFIPLKMVMFSDVGLPENSNDREVWRFTVWTRSKKDPTVKNAQKDSLRSFSN